MEYIFQACDEVGTVKINVGTGMSLPNLFQSDEEKANAQKNSRMMEDIGDDIKYCFFRLNDNKDDLKNIYHKKVVEYWFDSFISNEFDSNDRKNIGTPLTINEIYIL